MKADLHTHSYYSDGMNSPAYLVKLAEKRKLDLLVLTDHNSIKGTEETLEEGKKRSVKVFSGVEVAAKEGEVLGYFVDYKNPKLQAELKRFARFHDEKTRRKIEVLQKSGLDVSYDELAREFPLSIFNYNTLQLAVYLGRKYPKRNVDKLLKNVFISPPDEHTTFLIEAIELIKKYKGVPVLAHPWLMKPFPAKDEIELYFNHGLSGIEYNNGDDYSFGRNDKNIKQIEHYANEFSLIMTRGSDYHGLSNQINTGHDLGNTYSDEKTIELLLNKKP